MLLLMWAELLSGSTRNPVTYSDVDRAGAGGLDIEALEVLSEWRSP